MTALSFTKEEYNLNALFVGKIRAARAVYLKNKSENPDHSNKWQPKDIDQLEAEINSKVQERPSLMAALIGAQLVNKMPNGKIFVRLA